MTRSALSLITSQTFPVQNSGNYILTASHWVLLAAQKNEQLYEDTATLATGAYGK